MVAQKVQGVEANQEWIDAQPSAMNECPEVVSAALLLRAMEGYQAFRGPRARLARLWRSLAVLAGTKEGQGPSIETMYTMSRAAKGSAILNSARRVFLCYDRNGGEQAATTKLDPDQTS